MTNWEQKAKAFLHLPPDAALHPFDSGRDEVLKARRDQIAAAVGGPRSLDAENLAAEAHRLAAAADVLPCVDEASSGFDFLDAPLLIHPLSGQPFALSAEQPFCHLSEAENPEDWKQGLRQGAIEAADAAIRETAAECGGDSEKLFLTLWRSLPEQIARKDTTGLAPFWNLMPADPRVPTHTIWDRASIASALASTVDERGQFRPATLIFTVASVQDWMAASRRTQDLWMGSFLLSYLCWEGIRVIAEECGPDCVLSPSLRGQPLVDLWLTERSVSVSKAPSQLEKMVAGFPNVVTAIVPESGAARLAEDIVDRMKAAWGTLSETVEGQFRALLERTGECLLGCDDSSIWQRQRADGLLDGLGCFWVCYPWGADAERVCVDYKAIGPSSGSDRPYEALSNRLRNHFQGHGIELPPAGVYQLVSGIAGRALVSRKNLRDFRKCWEPSHKCSLCGIREALHPDYASVRARSLDLADSKDYAILRHFWDRLRQVARKEPGGLKLQGRIRKGEFLCSVCLARRLALETYFKGEPFQLDHHVFPSAATVATAAFRLKLIQESERHDHVRSLLEDYTGEMKGFVPPGLPATNSAMLPRLVEEAGDYEDFLRIDGEWLYPESFDLDHLNREFEGLQAGPSRATRLRRALESLLRAAEVGTPPRYYALIAMDGDRMGRWLSGALGPDSTQVVHPAVHDRLQPACRAFLEQSLGRLPRPLSPSAHLRLSVGLGTFALVLARDIVEQRHCGKLVYAGGDDLLALVPVADLLSVMRELRLLFGGDGRAVRNAGAGRERTGITAQNGFVCTDEGQGPRWHMAMGTAAVAPEEGLSSGVTVSMGIVVAHHSHPLSHAVEAAQKALKESAKDALGRNAFAIHALKRSGNPLEVGAKWEYGERGVLEVVARFVELMTSGKLSPKLAYDLSVEHFGLQDWGEQSEGELEEARVLELRRLLGRHVHAVGETDKAQLVDELAEVFLGMQKGIGDAQKELSPRSAGYEDDLAVLDRERRELWGKFQRLLLLARFIAREA